ncbi:hypothetical protein MTR67_022369 [Solanum verrucosum]|uniref:Uncharacterized protein n=1 Tax=Solanum verrucosum TaxID=315347 RepID=A0AAF0QZX2_SOLVR|nr:hypothetical protein MTR67_022369 [Solanum verrucosum]
MPTNMKFLSLVSNDLLSKGKAVSYDCQSSYHRKVGLSGIFTQIKKESTSDIMKCDCQDCHHTFSTVQQKLYVLFLFFRSHIIWTSCILQDPGLLWLLLVEFLKFLLNNIYWCRYMCCIDVNLYSYIDHLEEILVYLMRDNRKQLTRDIRGFSARSVGVCDRFT